MVVEYIFSTMPKYYEEKEEDNRACAGIKEDFKACLLQHDCVLKVRMSSNISEFMLYTLVSVSCNFEFSCGVSPIQAVVHCICQEGKLPSQCLKEGHCKALQTSFFECKRSLVCFFVVAVVVLKLKFKILWNPKTITHYHFLFFFSQQLDTRARFRGRKVY